MAIYAVKKSRKQQKVEVHALPCKIHHNGAIDATSNWKPARIDDETTAVHFRGRSLRGRVIKLPASYEGIALRALPSSPADNTQGHILKPTEKVISGQRPRLLIPREDDNMDDDEAEEEQQPDVKEMESMATFDDLVIWGHGTAPAAADDPYAKGIQEWLAFAEAVHCSDVS